MKVNDVSTQANSGAYTSIPIAIVIRGTATREEDKKTLYPIIIVNLYQ